MNKYTSCKICSGDIISFLPQFELVKCTVCGLIFFEKRLTFAEVKEVYENLYNDQGDYTNYKNQAMLLKSGKQPRLGYNKEKILHALLQKKTHKIVEVGAGVGIAGFYLKGKSKEYKGIELDAEASRLANEAGVDVENSSFEYLAEIKNADAIIAFEVLEHIDDLKLCLQYMYDSLKVGGILGFTVPNFDRFYNLSNEMQKKSLGQVGPPVHINFFTVNALQQILSVTGFKTQHLRARPYPSLNWDQKSTYKKLWQSVKGKYYGSTIICLARKVK